MDTFAKSQTHDQTRVGERLTLVQQTLIALNGAFKKILLYPPEHVIYQSSLDSLKKTLDRFIVKHGDLALKIERHQIRYGDEVVHDGPMNEENLAFILFRDGVYHLQFQASIALWELHSFLEILKKYQTLVNEAENDIVTALWELDLPSLTYKAEDVGFDAGEVFEIPELGGADALQDTPDPATADSDILEPDPALQPLIRERHLWEITAEDREHLRNMLVEEEDWERIEYVLYILLYILEQQTQPDDFSEVMAFLNQELQEAMADHKYRSVFNTFQLFRKNLERPKLEDHWSIPLLEDFFASLSTKTFLHVMQDDWDHIAECVPEELAYLKRALLMLNAEAIGTLAPMLLETSSNQTKKLLMVVIGSLAEREFEHLEKLLSLADPELLIMLIYIMGFMKNKASFHRLPDLLDHESADVRIEALKALYRRKSSVLNELSKLMNDPDEELKQLFLQYAARQRDVKTERMLRDYLEKNRIRSGNKQFLFRVYISLGKCGSDESLPFLKKDLFFLPGLGIRRSKNSIRRQAALYALKGINTKKAQSMMNR